jgi:hypothetical protein
MVAKYRGHGNNAKYEIKHLPGGGYEMIRVKQDWSVGEMVNVGFLRLRVIEVCGEAHRSYKLTSPDLSKMYAFSPYDGLHRVYEGE